MPVTKVRIQATEWERVKAERSMYRRKTIELQAEVAELKEQNFWLNQQVTAENDRLARADRAEQQVLELQAEVERLKAESVL